MLSVDNLNVFYGESHVLHDLSFDLAAGETVAVMGRNGMGKTTLLKALIGMIPSRSGHIKLNERDLVKAKSYDRVGAGFGYVPQGRMIFPYLSVEENILSGMDRFKRPVIPEYIFESFPILQEMRHRRGGNLSGGQQQQLAIGRALLTNPKLLILDEPTEGIQPSIVKEIEAVIQSLKGSLSILLVEQFYDFAESVADDYVVLVRGQVVSAGRGDQMENNNVRSLISV
jgi:urea transport system ATP-binding protein